MEDKVIITHMNEDEILTGLLEAANAKEETTYPVEIARGGKVLFRFRIRPLGADEYAACREKYTKYVRNKALGGIRMPEDTDTLRYNSAVILTATVDEDRKAVWENKKAWDRLGVLNAVDLIDKVLLAGEKDKIIELIDKISGYESTTSAEDRMEETAKN